MGRAQQMYKLDHNDLKTNDQSMHGRWFEACSIGYVKGSGSEARLTARLTTQQGASFENSRVSRVSVSSLVLQLWR